MRSSKFGERVGYYQEDNPENYCQQLSSLVLKNGFESFSDEGITSYLTFRYPIGDLTMFDGYKRIPFGYEFKKGNLIKNWHPRFKEKKIPFKKALEKIEKLLIKAIQKLTKEKKTAVALSGGVDSSLLVPLYRKIYPDKEIRTYSAGFYGEDEFEYARLVAKKFRTAHQEKILYKEDYIGENSLLKPLVKHKGAPLHPNELALANIEKMAKEDGCEIMLCGEGGDDIFGGYGQNLRMYMNYKHNQPFFKFFLDNYRYFSLDDRRKVIKDKYLTDDLKLLSRFLDEKEMPKEIENWVFYFTQKIHTPGLIIRGVNAMRFNGFKPGFPYIDLELVEFVNSLPFDYKVRWKSAGHQKRAKKMYFRDVSEKMDVPKYILKKIAEKYLPSKVIYRPKYGFPVPFEKWLADLKEWPLNQNLFKTTDLSAFSGWKKFMLINLDTFIKEFSPFLKKDKIGKMEK